MPERCVRKLQASQLVSITKRTIEQRPLFHSKLLVGTSCICVNHTPGLHPEAAVLTLQHRGDFLAGTGQQQHRIILIKIKEEASISTCQQVLQADGATAFLAGFGNSARQPLDENLRTYSTSHDEHRTHSTPSSSVFDRKEISSISISWPNPPVCSSSFNGSTKGEAHARNWLKRSRRTQLSTPNTKPALSGETLIGEHQSHSEPNKDCKASFCWKMSLSRATTLSVLRKEQRCWQ